MDFFEYFFEVKKTQIFHVVGPPKNGRNLAF